MSKTIPITVTILTKNAERYLIPLLNTLKAFDEVLLLDNGSQDKTLTIAQHYPNVSIHYHEFDGFGPMKSRAATLARNDWIFNIDSDEIPSTELLTAIQTIDFSQTYIIYQISRLNHYRGRAIKACWYPDILPRIYHRQHTNFNQAVVHETIQSHTNSSHITLKGELLHYSFDGVESLLNKMQSYSTLGAKEQYQSKKSSISKAILHGLSMFIKDYLIKQGFRYGKDGFIIAITSAAGSFYKYIKMYEYANQPSFPAGSRIHHSKFGYGTVLQTQPLYIAFDNGGYQTLSTNDAQLSKVADN